MAIVQIDGVGDAGLVYDVHPHELPPNAWSAGQNVRMRDGYVEKFMGNIKVFPTWNASPHYVQPVITSAGVRLWVGAGLAKVYITDGSTNYNITRQTAGVDVDYSATAELGWTGVNFNGVLILNNGVNSPQMQLPIGTATRLSSLTAWDPNWKAACVRALGSQLVALDVTKSGVRYPFLVKWSHSADPGTVPSSWDETDATKFAGEYPLAADGGEVVDLVPLGESGMLYKRESMWKMTPVASNDIFSFAVVFSTAGILNKKCAVEFVPGQHAVFGPNDCYIHNGSSAKSILSRKMRRWLYSALDPAYVSRAYVMAYQPMSEVWFCFCVDGAQYANLAVIWNWETNAIGVRDLPYVAHMAAGVVTASIVGTWNSLTMPWDYYDSVPWNELSVTRNAVRPIGALPNDFELSAFDFGSTANGTAYPAFVERQGLGIPFDQEKPPDITSMKTLLRIWPRLSGSPGGVVKVSVGTHMLPGDEPVYQPAQDFILGTSTAVDVIATGRLFALKFETTTETSWRLHGYTLDVLKQGSF